MYRDFTNLTKYQVIFFFSKSDQIFGDCASLHKCLISVGASVFMALVLEAFDIFTGTRISHTVLKFPEHSMTVIAIIPVYITLFSSAYFRYITIVQV